MNVGPEVVERHQTDRFLRWCRLQGGEVHEDDDLVVAIVGLPVFFTNNVCRVRLQEGEAEERVAGVAAMLRERGVPAVWWVGPLTTPPSLGDVLSRHGFAHEEDMPWMAADLDRIPDLSLPPGIEAFRVDSDERQALWLEAMQRGFGRDDEIADVMARLARVTGDGEDAEWQRFVAIDRGEPVGSAGVMFGGGVAGIYNMATAEPARGRGIGAAMATTAMRWARERGYDTAILGSSSKAVGLYERLGFRHVCRMSMYVFEPG